MKKKFIKYVSFNMLSCLGYSCYCLADTLFIANGVGVNGLTALNIVLPIYYVIFAIGLLLGVGGATRFSILKAQNEDYKASQYYSFSIVSGIIFSLIIMMIGFTFTDQIICLLGGNNEILPISRIYFRSFLPFTPFFILQQIIVTFVKNDTNPRLASIAMIAGSLFNIVFDYIFVFPCNLGMMGAALATGFSPIITLIICSLHFIKKQNTFHFIKPQYNLSYIFNMIKTGIPTFITELSSGIIVVVFNMMILSISTNVAVASYGILSNIAIFVTGLYNGIAQGIQPLLSQSYGLKEVKVIKKYLQYSIITSLTVSIIVMILVVMYPDTIVSYFNSENNQVMQSIAVAGLPIYFSSFFFIGINMVLTSYFSSITEVKPSSMISILRSGVIVIPLVILLANILGLTGIWLSYAVSELIIMIIGIILLLKHKIV